MSKTSPAKVTRSQRRQQCVALRRSGKSCQEIGDELGISRQAAHKQIQNYLEETATRLAEDGEHVRIMEAERLDRLQLGLWEKAIQGEEKAVDKIIKIMERRARLLGLDAPAKIAPTDPAGDKPYDPITDTERTARLAAILNDARARRDREALVSPEKGGADTG